MALFVSRGAFCLRVSDFEIFYERIRWPAISSNQIMAVSVAKSFEFVSLSVSFIFLALRVDGVKRSRNS